MGAFGRPFSLMAGCTEQHITHRAIRPQHAESSAPIAATVRSPHVAVRLRVQTACRLEANRAPVLIRPDALAVDTSRLHAYDLPRRNPALRGRCLSRGRRRQALAWTLAVIEPDVRVIGRAFAPALTNDKCVLNGRCLGIAERDANLPVTCTHNRPVCGPVPGHQHLALPSPASGRELGPTSVQHCQFGLGHRCLVGHIDISKPVCRTHSRHGGRGKTWRADQCHHANKTCRENRGIVAKPLHRDGIAVEESAQVVTDIV